MKKRHVFYLPGYDPRGPVHYHQLYRQEAAKQAAIGELDLSVSRRRKVSDIENAWTVETPETKTEYSFLRYEDLIRKRWPNSAGAMYAAILNYTIAFARLGVLSTLWRSSWPTFVAVTYPAALVAGMFLIALLAAFVFIYFTAALLGPFAYLAIPIALCLPFLLYKPINTSLNAFWLARTCAFLADRSAGHTSDVDVRCVEFANRIVQEVRDGNNGEVLVVGHSAGTILAITVLAKVIAALPDHARISFLTIGQIMAAMPRQEVAEQFRADLLQVAISDKIHWIDVTSAVDGSCIALTDPLAISGVERPPGAIIQPKLVSARFHALFKPETYAKIRRDFFRTHFQYLMATELPGDYDYFQITAGDLTLEQRFAHLKSVTDFNRFRTGKA